MELCGHVKIQGPAMSCDLAPRSVNVSLACFAGMRQDAAARLALSGVRAGALTEPMFGAIAADHVQLVPQCLGLLTPELATCLRADYPETRFRLHANVRVLERHRFADIANLSEHVDWFAQAARISRALDAPAYSAHAGRRVDASLADALDNARRLADLFACAVAVEGMYPTADDRWLLSSWTEYAELLDSGVPFALDLSHVAILAASTGRVETTLVREMLASPACIECHVSDNDGRHDEHRVCQRSIWWESLLCELNPAAVVFTEGNHLRELKGTAQQAHRKSPPHGEPGDAPG
jgi:hypothetical protein